ncbi:uncharacterized protein ASPGLDRAFT_46548 [Aspergillus glaucus CBS 516.65]|uniref:Pectate lyase domain-containing protein n=1 Tax=Aspergillus glaucus CBS 516.65 TaxID=1160497 RepID=A0A1L9VL47_ASPGL|nr:hypothetical protein ASPGLDRAFT_46548 [Aspergillus glaucus CBS 516.65]OJJ84658.1 hypothetical protein ASPGLDRAFT_46548 [Aspergillus glaucus CBS 516.65]
MLNLKLLLLATLFLATQVFASRISYSTTYTEGGVSGHGGVEQKAAGNIPNDKDKFVLDNIKTWSHNKFQARKNRSIILVSSVQKVKTKGQAASNNNEAQQLVNRHVRSH